MRLFVNSLLLFFLFSPLLGQESPRKRKPVLVRSEVVDAPKEEEVIVEDPEVAKKNVNIGDFYFKRDNYKAAEERYRDAIKYNPKWPKAYEKLIQALEKQSLFEKALEVCNEFMERNPSSKEIGAFQKLAAQLKEKATTG